MCRHHALWPYATCFLLWPIFAISAIASHKVRKFSSQEIPRRLQLICDLLISLNPSYGEVREPPSRAINLVRTIRDHKWVMLPMILLVEGDVVQQSPNDEADFIVRRKISPSPASGDLYVVCTPSPLRRLLEGVHTPPSGFLDNQDQTLPFLALFVTTLCIMDRLLDMQSELIGKILPALVVGFLLSSPLWRVMAFCAGNAHLICLTEFLQKSKTPYTETGDVDEFDEEAPPPTKDVTVKISDILRKIQRALSGHIPDFLFWTHDLIFTLAHTSVVAFLDREGPISNSYPMPLEVAFPSPSKDDDLSFGEFIMDPNSPSIIKTEYVDGTVRDEDLKALALSIMVSSPCDVHKGNFNRDFHTRFSATIYPGRRLDPVFRTCTCSISRELGFHASAAATFKPIQAFWVMREVGISTLLTPVEYQGIFSRILRDQRDGKYHLFSFGDLTTVACLCSYQWNSRRLGPLSVALKNRLIELDDNLAASDLQCIGISYRPLMVDPARITFDGGFNIVNFASVTDPTRNDVVSQMSKDQIFLGALISGYEPKEDMQELIDDLENCGIRFVYFSPYSESITKAYGNRLGLETDWNSCIILSDPGPTMGEKSAEPLQPYTDPKSKLPRGVANIRPHLRDVDDIPLHISLFAESDAKSVSEMLKIYRENGETAICLGSTLGGSNLEVFGAAILSIGMEPPYARSELEVSTTEVASFLSAIVCPLTLPFDCSPYVLTEIIREARNLYRGSQEGLRLRQTATISLLLAAPFMGVIPFWGLFHTSLIIFVASLLLLFPPYEPDILKLMPVRLDEESRGALIKFMLERIALNSILLAVAAWLVSGPLLTITLPLVVAVMTITFQHSRLSIYEFGPQQSRTCLIAVGAIGLSSILTSPLTLSISLTIRDLVTYVIKLCALLLLTLIGNETIKWQYNVHCCRLEKRAKLQFNTKLGMHSPV